MATAPMPLNEDDDLFNFDGADRGAPTVQPPSPAAVPEPAALGAPPAAASAVTEPLLAVETAGAEIASSDAPLPVHQAPSVEPVSATPSDLLSNTTVPASPVAETRRPSTLTLALVGLAMLLNLLLAGAVWHSMSGVNSALLQVADHAVRNAANPEAGEVEPPKTDEGGVTLDIAAEEIRHGEYERARARIYSLLSVLDRFEPGVRPNLAARAQVLAADAYREQADAIEREALGLQAPDTTAEAAEDHE